MITLVFILGLVIGAIAGMICTYLLMEYVELENELDDEENSVC